MAFETRPIGEAGLGAHAYEQIRRARSDPRLTRGPESAVEDFWQALEEAERSRMLSVQGLRELALALSRHEREQGETHMQRETQSILQAAWERAELARIELDSGYPHLNAQALLSYCSALDAMVENILKSWRFLHVMPTVDKLMAAAEREAPSADVNPDALDALREVVAERIARKVFGKAPALRDPGPVRYERLLARVGLQAPDDRPLPEGLVNALTELHVLRNVLMHRAGRIDLPALRSARTLVYKQGQLVRIDPDSYRRYSSAVRCYALEIIFRATRTWPSVADNTEGPKLDRWEHFHVLGA